MHNNSLIDTVCTSVLCTPSYNNNSFALYNIHRFVEVPNGDTPLANYTVQLVTFRLHNDQTAAEGEGPDKILELILTVTPREYDSEGQQPPPPRRDFQVIVAPRICWDRQHVEMFRQFAICSDDDESATDQQQTVNQNLVVPIARLHNSLNVFIKLMATEDVRRSVLASLVPSTVARMELVSVFVRNNLLRNTVDNDFWKVRYEREFGPVAANDRQQITYRERYSDRMRLQIQSRRLFAQPLHQVADVPDEPLVPSIAYPFLQPQPRAQPHFPPYINPVNPHRPYHPDPLSPHYHPNPRNPLLPNHPDPLSPHHYPDPRNPRWPQHPEQPDHIGDPLLDPQHPGGRPNDGTFPGPAGGSGPPDMPPFWTFNGPGTSGGSGGGGFI